MGNAGAGGEEESAGASHGDLRCVAISRRLVERARESAAVGVADGWAIQPIDAAQWRVDCSQRPLAARRVGDRDVRRLAARVVASENLVTRAAPAVVALVVCRRNARL